ncbi:hypothetical protein [Desulfoluna butyratoxydans]|uniref:Fibronectin type iii n=1 Tax=Desulfoluna butyratoxydans TaxID=231438 RepID=A0A4V6ILH5_9BACT|nr:hypothetical protein [Desulfoluna butyratoxydans]VFQ45118.1 fibronectin type iii [Desulfoluna butyratoxydans]
MAFILRFGVLFLMSLAVGACGSSGGSSGTPDPVGSSDEVSLESPVHGATLLNKEFSLAWSPSKTKGESRWGVTVSTEVDGIKQTVMTLSTTAQSYRPLQLSDNTTYTWKVEALNDEGESVAASKEWSFHTFPTRMLPFDGALDRHSSPDGFTAFEGAVYFSAYSPEYGRELWRKQGNAPAEQVADIHAGDKGSLPMELTVCGPCLYFSADDGTHGRALWVMRAGQAPRLAGPEVPAPDGEEEDDEPVPGRVPTYLTAVGEALYFAANGTVEEEVTLWRQGDDASAAEEVTRAEGEGALQNPEFGTAYNGRLYVSAFTSDAGRELWRVEGTTAVLQDINPGDASGSPKEMVVYGSCLYFRATLAGHGSELWVVDGDAGPALLKEIAPGGASGAPGGFAVAGDTLFFAADTMEHGRELWRSDGTGEGTVCVKDILTEPSLGSQPAQLAGANGVLYFKAQTHGEGFELWKSDGTEEGTVLVRDIRPGEAGSGIGPMVPFGGGVIFPAEESAFDKELWFSEGEFNTTFRLRDIRVGEKGSYPEMLKNLDGTLWFRADDGVRGSELWQSDGTEAGTRLTDNLNPYVDPDVDQMVRVGGRAVMVATSGEYGRELFTFNAEGGVEVLADIFPGYGGSDPEGLFVHDDRLYFSARDEENDRSLWVTRGTLDSTERLTDRNGETVAFPRFFAAGPDAVFFLAVKSDEWQLWKTSGTKDNTEAVTDENHDVVVVGPYVEGSDAGLALATAGDRVFFRVGGDLRVRESSGEVVQVPGVENPEGLYPVEGSLLFAAQVAGGSGPSRLWLLAAGQSEAGDPLESPQGVLLAPENYHRTGDLIYFSALPEGQAEHRLIRFSVSDNTVTVPTDAEGGSLTNPDEFCGVGGLLWMIADVSESRGIWQLPAGGLQATPLSSLAPGEITGLAGSLRTVGDALYFLADHPLEGKRCLYKTRGATLGPVLDYYGRPLLNAKQPFVLNDYLFLTAMNQDVGSGNVFQGFWVTSP